MKRVALLLSSAALLLCPAYANAVSLESLFSDFQKCRFPGFYYAPWDTTQPVHPYFSERNLRPHKESGGVYYFLVKDSVFGLKVSELIVPGTNDYHGIIFDVPFKKTRAVFKQKFGTIFTSSDKSFDGDRPALKELSGDPSKSILYCVEREGGL